MEGNGWIKLNRKILNNPIVCKDSDYFSVWCLLLLLATHTPINKVFKGKKIILREGQLITGRKFIANLFKISESKVQRILKGFENEHQIEQQTSSQNRLITIINWREYQNNEQPNGQRVNNEWTTSEHIQEYKNINILNKYIEQNPMPKTLFEKMKLIREIKSNENLTPEEETELENYILGVE